MNKRIVATLLALVAAAAVIMFVSRPDVDEQPPPVAAVGTPLLEKPQAAALPGDEQALKEDDAEVDYGAAEEAFDSSQCANRLTTESRASREDARQVVLEASDKIRTSSDPELVLASAAIDKLKNPERAMQSLQTIGGEHSTNPVALNAIMGLCDQRSSVECDYAAIERNVRNNHSANGVFWLGLAGEMLDDGRDDAAFEAIGQAIAAPVYDHYFDEQLMLLERGLAASTDWSFSQRVFHAVEFAFSSATGMRSITRYCSGETGGQWSLLCDQLADSLVEYDGGIFPNVMGLELKQTLLDARDDEEGLAVIEERIARLKGAFEDEDSLKEIANGLLNDEVLLRTFLENLSGSGEMTAIDMVKSDIERLKATDGYDQCNFAGNPYVRL